MCQEKYLMAFDFRNIGEVDTGRLLLRKITKADVSHIYSFTSNPVGKEFLSWEPHESIGRTAAFVDFLLTRYESGDPVQWGIELKETQTIIGITGFVDYTAEHNRGEIAYLMSPDYEGKGYMTEANGAVLRYGFEIMRLNRIQAKAELLNIASQKVMEKIGMAEEGVMRQYIYQKGAYRDYKLYSILSSEYYNGREPK